MNFVIKSLLVRHLLFILIIFSQGSYAESTLRFQPEINDKATCLGDVLIISADEHQWANVPLDSHPTPGDVITKKTIIRWMELKLGPVNPLWLGKTQIRVKKTSTTTDALTTGTLLIDQAKIILLDKLKTRYKHVKVTPLSKLKQIEYTLEDFDIEPSITFPVAKRVCVWLKHKKYNKHIPLWFKVEAYADVWIAKQDLRPDGLISQDSLMRKTRNIAGLNTPPLKKPPTDIWLKSSIQKGHIVLKDQLKKPPLVTRGQHLKIAIHNQHITILIDTIAQADGYLGDTIQVKNSLTHQNLYAKIRSINQAELTS